MRIALGRFQSECSSTMMSIRSPTASRILRNGSSALAQIASEIYWPPVASAYGSKGQIFMPVMPCSSRLSRERPGVVQEPVEVLVGPGRGWLGVPVRDRQPGGLRHAADVAVAGAGVVGADPLARGAAEQLVDRLAADLAEEVPERDVDRRAAALLDAGGVEADERVQRRASGASIRERVLAEQVGGGRLVHPGRDGLGAEERLAEPADPLVGVDADVAEVRELADQDRLEPGDLHPASSAKTVQGLESVSCGKSGIA